MSGHFVFDKVDGDSSCSLQNTDDSSFFGTVGLSGMEQLASHLYETDNHTQIIVYKAIFQVVDDVQLITDIIECNAYRSVLFHVYK